MSLSRNKLYVLVIVACIAGYAWLYIGVTASHSERLNLQVCIIKHVTDVPCPSCGSTRSVISILHGDYKNAAYMNPFGFIISAILLIAPLWILFDIVSKKSTLYETVGRIEVSLGKAKYAIPLVVLVLVNWIWNISKGL